MTAPFVEREDYRLLQSEYEDPSSLTFKKLRLVDSYIAGGKNLLDFGVGTGELINLERQKFSNIYGIDADEESVRICEDRFQKDKNIRLYQSNGSVLVRALGDIGFDYITACDVLEHVPLDESKRLLRVFYSLLDGGGHFIFTGPGIFEKARITMGHSPTHVHSHSSYGWAELIRNAGLQVVSIESVEFPLIHSAILRKRLHVLGKCCVIQARKGRQFK